jgi:hypothetical protein
LNFSRREKNLTGLGTQGAAGVPPAGWLVAGSRGIKIQRVTNYLRPLKPREKEAGSKNYGVEACEASMRCGAAVVFT